MRASYFKSDSRPYNAQRLLTDEIFMAFCRLLYIYNIARTETLNNMFCIHIFSEFERNFLSLKNALPLLLFHYCIKKRKTIHIYSAKANIFRTRAAPTYVYACESRGGAGCVFIFVYICI